MTPKQPSAKEVLAKFQAEWGTGPLYLPMYPEAMGQRDARPTIVRALKILVTVEVLGSPGLLALVSSLEDHVLDSHHGKMLSTCELHTVCELLVDLARLAQGEPE
jgi:hypothetical protein